MDSITTAKQFIDAGFNVLPLQLDGSKAPIGAWKPYQARFASEHEIDHWFGTEQCGIGVVAGAISGNLHVIDFDHDAEKHFAQFWADVQNQLPGITEKLLAIATPRPGRQVWFRQSSPPPASQILAYSEPLPAGDTDSERQPILQPQVTIETRGTGGYACAPGTPSATHKSGRPYQLVHGCVDNLPTLSDDEAETILAICRSYSRFTPQQVQAKPGSKYQGEPRPGDVYNQQTELRQLLLDAGWKPHHRDDEGTEYLTRPGKEIRDGFSASLGRIRSDDNKPLLYVFSSNATPFQPQTCYDAFACYALLHHRADFGAAAASVRVRYAEQVQNAQQQYHATVAKQLPEPGAYQPFPTKLFPDVVQSYVTEHAAAINIDPAYVGLPMLSVLAGLIGQSRRLQVKRGFEQPSIVWAVTIGDVACGKTPGWEAATAPAERIESALHAMMQQRDADYQEQLDAYETAKAGGDTSATKPTREKDTEQLTINDATMETLIDIHSNNPKLLLACDELAAWLRSMDQYRQGKGRDVENWLSIYNGGGIQVNRKTDGYRAYLRRTSISVCGTIQPGVAAETLFTDRFIENGFAARVLSASPPSEIVRWSDREVPQETDDAMHRLAEQLYALPMESCGETLRPLLLPCSDAAKRAFIRWTDDAADHAEPLSKSLRDNWLKLRPLAGRFALILSIVKQLLHRPDGQAMQAIDQESMRSGIELAWWFGREFERNYEGDEQAELKEHLQWIRNKHPRGLDARMLVAGRRSIKKADDARIVMQKLAESGYGRIEGSQFIALPMTT
ncbi:hypothetical protein Mal15_28570 [Stieleria maiorica]|uniref:DNA primase/polymerase bifunctional N-terminal domain-containing protein n=1 Tax=Stieleria maiorica TaxID=2795974 RepID=A0A5B9MBX1_9BACT|nr:DUF3987 domain-containing protein [Stieleria maiorica]QEF98801.1 hypothetical protein Mal15_28570 [Stieleria maiorica]